MNKDALLVQWNATKLPIPDGRVSLVLTDPPYAVMQMDDLPRGKIKPIKRRIAWDEMDVYEWMGLMSGLMRELYRVCDRGATAYVFCSQEYLGRLSEIGTYNGWHYRMPIYWHRTNPAPKIRLVAYQQSMEVAGMFTKGPTGTFNADNGGKCHNLYSYPTPNGGKRVHDTQKSLDLMVQLILMSSNPGDIVLDCFMGSGVVGEACIATKRLFIGGDLSYAYVRDMAMFKVHNRAYGQTVKDAPIFEGMTA